MLQTSHHVFFFQKRIRNIRNELITLTIHIYALNISYTKADDAHKVFNNSKNLLLTTEKPFADNKITSLSKEMKLAHKA